ncbi:MAG: hypothetical protein NW241_22935 [Bacteroidia bacterium]|nr:hypothetical protein [Bacteroidia bacterium]
MNLTFASSPAWLLLIVPAAGALTWWMYRHERDALPRGLRWLLMGLRFLALALAGLLLLGPLLSRLQRVTRIPVIAVLQDNSESLVVQRDSAFVRNEYPALLKELIGSFNPAEYQVDLYAFGEALQSGASPDSLRFDRPGTNPALALREIRKRYQGQNLGAVVLISDGIATAGEQPVYAVEGMKQPVHTVLLGDTTPQRDVLIQEVRYNEIAYLGSDLPVRVKLQASGYPNTPVQVSLSDGTKVLGTQTVTFGGREASAEASFVLRPETAGLQGYTVTVSRQEGEVSYRNNVSRFFIQVLETRVKIALFAGSPHPDVGALRQAFDREDSYEYTEFVLRRPGEFYVSPASADLSEYQLFILHNFPQSSADQATVNTLLTLIRDQNKPAMFFTGAFTDLRTLAPLYDYMAIAPKSAAPASEEVTLQFKPSYRNHSTYTFGDDWIAWAGASPPFFRNMSAWEAKSTAEVLATLRIKNVPLDYPMVALQQQLGRKNMVFLGENFWRMRAHSYAEKQSFDYFDDWLFNSVKWLMAAEDQRRFKVETNRRQYQAGEQVLFRGQAYDDSNNPLDGVEIKVLLRSPGGQEAEYFLSGQGSGQYGLGVDNLTEGLYTFSAAGTKEGRKIGEDRGQFTVGRSAIEHFRLQADRGLLQQLALRTGGSFRHARELPALADELKALPAMKPVIEYQRSRSSFHELAWLLALLLLLLGAEWVVRKVYSLS